MLCGHGFGRGLTEWPWEWGLGWPVEWGGGWGDGQGLEMEGMHLFARCELGTSMRIV